MRRASIIGDEHGNVLFLILIAVALFAALSYAVTSSSRSGSKDVSDEKAALIASQIISYGNALSTAVVRMTVMNGCEDTDISFETPSIPTSNYDYSHTPPVSDKCKVFSPAGGDVPYQEVKEWFDPALYVPGYPFYAFGDSNVPNVGTQAADLIVSLPWIPKNVCNAINQGLLGGGYSGNPPLQNPGVGASIFQGVYGPDGTYLFPQSSEMQGQQTGCFFDPVDNYYVFYQVLIAR